MSELPTEPAAPDDLDFGVAPSHVKPLANKTKFEQWHHPRKHEIRLEQWGQPVRALIRELGMTSGSTFQYLTLPGNEMLDVRALNSVCERENVELKYLGFNHVTPGSSEQAELLLSQSEVRDLKGVNRFSTVLEERLEALGRADSLAHHRMRLFGPFHAINIDLPSSLIERGVDDERGSPLGVLGRLLDTQLTTASPWLLFVTTKVHPDLVAQQNRTGFQDAIDSNIAQSPPFADALASCLSSTGDLSAHIQSIWDGQAPAFLRLFGTGLGKWLLKMLYQSTPQRRLTLLSSYSYRVCADEPDMLSLAFRCDTEPQSIKDEHGILPSPPPSPVVSEVDLAIKLTQKLQQTTDLDRLLALDPARAEERLKQAKKLMEAARFSADAYEIWARSELSRNRAILGLESENA